MFRIDRESISYVSISVESACSSGGEDEQSSVRSTIVFEETKRKALELAKKEAAEIIRTASEEAGEITKTASQEAAEMLRKSEESSKALVENALTEAERLRREAEEKGYKDGADKALAEAEIRRAEEAAELELLIEKINSERDEILDGLEDEIILLVMEIARKVVNTKIKREAYFVSMVQGAIAQLKSNSNVTLHMSADEYQRFFKAGKASFNVNEKLIEASVIAEPAYSRGDYSIETEGEVINFGVDFQLGCIEAAFAEGRDRSA